MVTFTDPEVGADRNTKLTVLLFSATFPSMMLGLTPRC